jgi:hypothetical protein
VVDEAERERLRALAVEGGKASGRARRAKAELRDDLKARMLFVAAAEDLAKEMLDAAMGRGKFVALDPKERAGLLKTCLEYAVGRPRPQDPLARDDDAETERSGFSFGVAEASEEHFDGEPEGTVEPEQAGDGSGGVPAEGP